MRKADLEKKVKKLEEELAEAQLQLISEQIAIEQTMNYAQHLIDKKDWQYSALGMCIGGVLSTLLYLIFG